MMYKFSKHVTTSLVRPTKRWLLPLVLSLLPACSVLDVINQLPQESGSTVETNVSYGTHPRQKLDIYRPTNPSEKSAVIVFFYGGAWDSGDRSQYEFVGRKLAAMGHYAVIPDYRLFPEVTFPAFVQDGAAATVHVIENLNDLSDRPRPVFLMGHSAGAHIAAMVSLDQRFLAALGHSNGEIAGFIGLAGPYDFLPIKEKRIGLVFPENTDRTQSQPINFIDKTDPPLFLGHGDQDKRVWLRNSENLNNKTLAFPTPGKLRVYPEIGHAEMLQPFVQFLRDEHGMLLDIADFIHAHSTK